MGTFSLTKEHWQLLVVATFYKWVGMMPIDIFVDSLNSISVDVEETKKEEENEPTKLLTV